ncbi:MAG: SGNH/GDSL hydrolase family protein [Eubacteriales bacterium]|nr:SGNH/GDSL hydrolase family protein [Eubacteriales bacterium]
MKQEDLTRGIVNRGNWHRLKGCMKRAEKGENLVVAFLGGSITQGSLASDDGHCYAYLTYQWWKKKFPQAEIRYVNGGIGGTSSLFGVARAEKDVLSAQPDVVFVDFTVNDDATEFFQETYEGVIRRLYEWNTNPAVVVLNNVYYDTGVSAQEYHNAVAAHYGVPCVSVRESIYVDLCAGKYERNDLTPDGLHPNDKGHGLLAGELIQLLERVYADLDQPEQEAEYPQPLTVNTYQQAVRYQAVNCQAELDGFLADTREKTEYLDHFKQGWTAARVGDRITFHIPCRNLAVQYRKSVRHPVPVAKVTVDGDEAHAVVLDGNFDETWGDCLYLQPVLHHGESGMHEVVIEVTEATDADVDCFYLMSLICA